MLDSFIARLSVLDAWRDYFDQLNQIAEKIISKFIHYDWQSLGRGLSRNIG